MTIDWEYYHYLRTVEHVDHATAMRYATELEDGEDSPGKILKMLTADITATGMLSADDLKQTGLALPDKERN